MFNRCSSGGCLRAVSGFTPKLVVVVVEPENDVRRDEYIQRGKELASLNQQLMDNKQAETKNAMVNQLKRQVDALVQNGAYDNEMRLFYTELLNQRQEQEESIKKGVDKYVSEKKESKENTVFLPVKKNIRVNKAVWPAAKDADLTIIQHENKLQYKEILGDIFCYGIEYLVPQIPNIWKIFKSKKPNDNGNNGFKKVTLSEIPTTVVLE